MVEHVFSQRVYCTTYLTPLAYNTSDTNKLHFQLSPGNLGISGSLGTLAAALAHTVSPGISLRLVTFKVRITRLDLAENYVVELIEGRTYRAGYFFWGGPKASVIYFTKCTQTYSDLVLK
jgi:hypothetical protein